ncbi:ester cyclase [Chitinophaga sp. RAB17]|uniref:ester cyclase n=1 Tax=Chitinophaga sp. RAB17 TaxID=3233049 RepID=UPI003F8FC03E
MNTIKTATATISLLLAGAMTPGIANARQVNKHANNKTFTMENNKAIVQELYETSLNKKQLELLPNQISEEFAGAGGAKGVKGFIDPFMPLINAFPDIQYKLITLVSEGDKVVVRWKWTGTQTGTFRNVPATGKTISSDGISIYEFKNGKIVGSDVQLDRLGILQSLDVVPANIAPVKPIKDQVQFIDKFLVPANAIAEFKERTAFNRQFIKTLPGFITDAEYVYTDEQGNLICITVAQWESREALSKAKETVQAKYKEQGFNPAEMFKRLGITADRGIYTAVGSN